MNRFRGVMVFAVVALLFAGGLAWAQAQGQGNQRRGPGRGFGIGGPAGLELRGVELSDVQRVQIRDIVQRYQQQMRADVLLVLTPEQQEQVKQNEARRDAAMKERLERLQQRQQNRQQQSQPGNN